MQLEGLDVVQEQLSAVSKEPLLNLDEGEEGKQ
jgi:hypothetical protein